jgi:hypothetical protein
VLETTRSTLRTVDGGLETAAHPALAPGGLSRLRRRRNRHPRRRRWSLILRAAKTKDRPENDAQKSEADSESHTFTEALRHIDAENDSYDDINERDEQQNDPPAGSADNLAPDVEIIDRDNTGPARLSGFREHLPHRNDQQQCEEQPEDHRNWARGLALR